MILDSSNVIDSPIINCAWVTLTISRVVALVCPAKIAIAPLSAPLIFSPRTVVVFSDSPLTKTNLSNTGSAKLTDSNTPTTLKTSGVFKDISLSWTLNPYPDEVVSPWVAIPALVLLITIELLLEAFLVFCEIMSFSRVTLTTFALYKVIKCNWLIIGT